MTVESSELPPEVLAAVADRLGGPPGQITVHLSPRGCINNAHGVSTPEGRRGFLKWQRRADPGYFGAEAEGLAALRSATAALRVPEVWGWGDVSGVAWLLLEFVPAGRAGMDYWRALGRGLAELHKLGSDPFGWERDNWIGTLPQANETDTSWIAFWRSRRVEPQLQLAHEHGLLDTSLAPWTELPDALEAALGSDVPSDSSLLHGDLWSGNVYPDERGTPVLIDPAVYRGHGEVDLAMADLFGGFGAGFHSAYREIRPVGPGYARVRRDVYQLYPLLVHVNLFGGHYCAQATRTATRIVRST